MFWKMSSFHGLKASSILTALAVLALSAMLSIPVQAHPPSEVMLSYDQDNQTLNVAVLHKVSSPSGHYVVQVDIFKNGEKILSSDYRSQPSTSDPFTYSYAVNATSGDVLKATAFCSIAGSRSGELTVGENDRLTVKSAPAASDLPLEDIVLPKGFAIQIFAQDLSYPRSLALGDEGTIFVGTRLPFDLIDSGDKTPVYAIQDLNGDGLAEESEIKVVDMLRNPNGVAFHEGSLYVAEIDRILRYDRIEANLDSPPEAVEVARLPYYILHGWRYIAFGPDEKLYVAVGADCNVCEPVDELNGTILRMNADGSDREVYAKGVRNSVGMDWSPSGELWFTDNGRDMLGNDIPSDELNHAPVAGLDFGFPTCHEKMPPAWALGPHVAALGMRFYQGEMFPAEYDSQIFIAEHGSWNRDEPIGYRLAAVKVVNDTAIGHQIFASGWLQEGEAWGRPVDVQPLPDGSLLVSDDLAGVIYRIMYSA